MVLSNFCYLRLDLRFGQWICFLLSFVTDGKEGETLNFQCYACKINEKLLWFNSAP